MSYNNNLIYYNHVCMGSKSHWSLLLKMKLFGGKHLFCRISSFLFILFYFLLLSTLENISLLT